MIELIIGLIGKVERGESFTGSEKDLALLDAEEFMNDFDELERKKEDVEYYLENAEDWIDDVVVRVLEGKLDTILVEDIIEDLGNTLKDELNEKAKEQIK